MRYAVKPISGSDILVDVPVEQSMATPVIPTSRQPMHEGPTATDKTKLKLDEEIGDGVLRKCGNCKRLID